MFTSLRLAFAMFSRIPMGKPDWSPRAQRYMMCWFPLVGVAIGIACALWMLAFVRLGLPQTIGALGLTLIPLAITGGIHLDGLADTCDALASNAEPERRRAILKDSHAGAFAIIGICVCLLTVFALNLTAAQFVQTSVVYTVNSGVMQEFTVNAAPGLTVSVTVNNSRDLFLAMTMRCALPYGLGFALSRTLSALAVTRFPTAADGLVKMFADAAAKRVQAILAAVLVVLVIALFFAVHLIFGGNFRATGILYFAALILAPAALFAYLKRMARVKFGGMSGDLAGWFLCICETLYLAVFIIGGYIA
jgi:adenosylcobinamide-GDP ribazoletransferase